jgi:hypothetical protein
MLVTTNQIKQGAALYLKNEVLPHLSNGGAGAFGFTFAATLAVGYIDKAVVNLSQHPLVSMFGIIDGDGRIELDALSEALTFAMPETGVSLPIGKTDKITFRREDIAKLCEYIGR